MREQDEPGLPGSVRIDGMPLTTKNSAATSFSRRVRGGEGEDRDGREEWEEFHEGSFWQQYKALVRRNLIIKKRERSKTITEFAMPLYFLVILVILRLTIPTQTYPPLLEPHDNGSLLYSVYAFSANIRELHVAPNNTEVHTVMDTMLGRTQVRPVYYESEDDLIKAYRKHPEAVRAALVFPSTPLANLTYTIRFNSQQLQLPDATSRSASDERCRAKGGVVGGLEDPINCPPNKYYSTGFLGLQYLLDRALIQLSSPSSASPPTSSAASLIADTSWLPDDAEAALLREGNDSDLDVSRVTFQSFPKDEAVSSNVDVLRSIVPLYMVFTWAQFIVYMLILIVDEKEKKIKEGMKMMGLQGIVYWLSWLTIYGAYVVVLATICIIVLPLSGVFQNANIPLVYLLFLLYGFSAIIMALMMTPFFSKAKVAGVVGNLTQVLMSLLFYVQVYVGDELDTGYYYLMALMSPCAFSLAIDKILLFDITSGGLSPSNLWDGPGLPFAGSLLMIVLDIVLYLALALYLDAVVPTEYGTREKPWFFLQPSFWRKRKARLPLRSYTNTSMQRLEEDEAPPALPRSVSGTNGYANLGGSARSTSSSTASSTASVTLEDVEPVGSELLGKAAVIIKGLEKTFHRGRGKDPVHAVQDFSLTIYEGQITAILGHNGAGKTTLFNMLTGMTEPSGGRATIFGLDVTNSSDLREIRNMTGVCPQHDILFLVLTPREHLNFYARIRGVPEHAIRSVVSKTLAEVDLVKKADSLADSLSGGQKRKLCIGIALIGDPRIIFLDEPTAGVDAWSRRRLWGLLKRRKQGKVILLTTHFMDEADVLADRKAVMTRGRLRCCGSSLFLKNKFGLGYHLTLIVGQDMQPDAVLAVLRRLIPSVSLARHYGKEMSFVVPYDCASQFTAMFSLLDEIKLGTAADSASVSIEDYGISMTTLEEVFLTLNEEGEGEDGGDIAIDNLAEQLIRGRSGASSPLHGAGPDSGSRNSPDHVSTPVQGGEAPGGVEAPPSSKKQGFAIEEVEVEYSPWRAFKSLLWMRILGLVREPVAMIFIVLFPLGFTIGSMALADSQTVRPPSDKVITFSPALLSLPQSALLHNGAGHPLASWWDVFNSTSLGLTEYNGSYHQIHDLQPQIGAYDVTLFPQQGYPSPGSQDVTLAYNTSFLHILPILLNILSNAGLRQTSPQAPLITPSSSLLPALSSGLEFDVSTFFAPMMIGFVYTMVPAILALEMVADREIKARNLLRLNGVTFNLYFSSFFCVLSIIYLFIYIGLLVIILAFDVASFTMAPAFTTLAVMYLIYLPGALVFSGFASYMFDKAETARQFYPNMATTIGFVTYTVVALVDMLNAESNAGQIVHCAFTITLPYYIPFGTLYYINKVYLECSLSGTCDSLTLADYCTLEIGLVFIMCLVNAVLYYVLLRVVDAWKTGGNIREALFMKVEELTDTSSLWQEAVVESPKEDGDVKAERLLVQDRAKQQLQTGQQHSPALIYNLGKVYKGQDSDVTAKKGCRRGSKATPAGEFTAVESVSLALKPGEVLGLLGPNGAGKTTTLRIVTAEESASRGAVWVCGGRVTSVLSPSLTSLGYCPQHDCLWRRLSIKEHLKVYADVRGVKEGQLDRLLSAYLDGLQIGEHSDKQSHTCSGGTKRKLSYIISMMGRPGVVLLDEPSTGMDPKSKRFLWDSILASFKGDRSAVLTTHSMEEADALCGRIGIMVKGVLRCVGSVQRLKNKYGGGYNLELKLSRSSGSSAQDSGNMAHVQSLITSTFPNASLDEAPFEERLVYKIPQRDVSSLAHCFALLEELKTSGRCVEYSFSQTTLEQVFLLFAKEQDQEEEDDDEGDDDGETEFEIREGGNDEGDDGGEASTAAVEQSEIL